MIPERRTLDRLKSRIHVTVYESSAGWAVRWQSERMREPIIWYHPNQMDARQAAKALQGWIYDREPTNG